MKTEHPSSPLRHTPPVLPAEDKVLDDPEGSLRLAVAFDVLATQTRGLALEPQILEKLTHALLTLRDSTQAPQERAALVSLARSAVGQARARLRAGLDRVSAEHVTLTGQVSRPIGPVARVHNLLALIDQATDLLVRQETLYIQSKTRPVIAKA